MTTTYDPLRDTTTIVSNVTTALVYPIGTSFTVVTTLLAFPVLGAMGIKVTNGANDLFYAVGTMAGTNVIFPDSSQRLLAMEWSNTDNTFKPYCSEDGVVWTLCSMPLDEDGEEMPYPTFASPTHAGIFFAAGDPFLEETVTFGSPRVLPGLTFVPGDDPDTYEIPETAETLKPIGTVPLLPPEILTPSEEATVHALVGAPFGDLEFDVGKSVGWLTRFVDDTFVTDVNLGTQRYWVVNWSKTFDYVYYRFSGINFFTSPVAYRAGQWADATKFSDNYSDKLVYDDNDWVIFLDAHEGLSVDNTSFPDDFLIAFYKSFIYREIARANAASRDRIVFPFFVYLNHKHIQNASQSYSYDDGSTRIVTQSCGVPYYLPYQGLTRMFKVSALRNPSFNWALLDTPVTIPDANVKVQIVSYSYAHWQLQDVPPGQTSVPPLDANNDDGWKQRCAISQVLPVTGLPVGSATNPVGTWKNPTSFPDPAGFRGPWAFDTYEWHISNPVIPSPPPAIATQVAGVRTPMYDLTFRINVRDGVWYDTDGVGNTTMTWDDTAQEFVPYVPPAA